MAAFKIVKNATHWWPVRWNEPVDGGQVVEQSLEMRFRRLPLKAARECFTLTDIEFIMRVATDWRDIVDDAERPVPFDDEFIREMVGRPAFMIAMGQAFMAFISGMPETRLGNSVPSPAGGQAAAAETVDQPITTVP